LDTSTFILSELYPVKTKIMSSSAIGFWNNKKEKLRQKFPFLTDEDVTFNEGKEKEMIEMIGNKMGKTKIELLYIIAGL
jgi:hypothetical protein